MTAVSTAAIPPTIDHRVFGKAFVHNLKSQLNSINGIASGTVTDIRIDWILLNDAASTVPGSKCTNPVNAKRIPTAYAATTVPIFFIHVQRLKHSIIITGTNTYSAMTT